MVAEHPKPEPGDHDKRDAARVILVVVLLALLVAFVVDNTRYVTVGFVFTNHRTRLIYVLIVTVVIGVAIDRLWQRRRHKE